MRIFWRALYWFLSLLLSITLAPIFVIFPYAAVIFFRGNLEDVKGWLIHARIEGRPLEYQMSHGQMTWFEALLPLTVASTISLVIWAIRRLLRAKFRAAWTNKS